MVVAVLLFAACGGNGRSGDSRVERVHFAATDEVVFDGRLFGEESQAGAVLVHMGRPGDSQVDWLSLAKRLSRDGYLVLTYNRRGVCPGGNAGCSRGVDDYASSWRDVAGAVAFLRRKGVERIAVIGASIGAMAALHAASVGSIHPEVLIEFGGINHASYDFNRAQIRRIEGAKMFLSSRRDIYGGADAAREWYGWASPPKRLELLPGDEHGTDLLQPQNALHDRVSDLIADFVTTNLPAES
jgi:pimeloyl-ACP methyl ester carboxylesterase